MRPFPDFVIAGSAKSGTTALYLMLDQHPDVYMSQIKETNFFVHGFEPTRQLVGHRGDRALDSQDDSDITDTLEKYRALFAGADSAATLGEASPWYLINKTVPGRLRAHRDDIKVVIILRNPSDVAFANFVHQVRDRAEILTVDEVDGVFEQSRYDREDLYPFCRHLELPRYSRHLPVWIDTFDRSQLHIMIYEEFRANRRGALSELFQFLGLRDDVDIQVDRPVNVSGMPKSKRAQDLLQGSMGFKKIVGLIVPKKPRRKFRSYLEKLNTGARVEMEPCTRERFDRLYTPDLEYVEALLGRRMSEWRQLRHDDA